MNITAEQLETIEHYQRMFRHNSEKIQELCSEEQDNVVYGFELGKMYSHLEECFMGMMKLTQDIRDNNNVLNK
tara:strand:- start:784 stop:1002 length:219 start_codon:yes stop_codon:yes gene_type:complete